MITKGSKYKGSKFKLPWEGPYKVHRVYNNNIVEFSILSNSDAKKVNINKLKHYLGEPPIVIMIIMVKIEGKISQNEGKMNIPHLPIYFKLTIKSYQKDSNLSYGIKMMTGQNRMATKWQAQGLRK
jgi:hypothetical protein